MIGKFTLASFAAMMVAPLVAAHGTLSGVYIDGVHYSTPMPLENSANYIARSVNSVDPVKGTDNPDLNCGHGAQPAGKVADAKPGSVVGMSWRNGEGGTWVHRVGVVMTYMASCGTQGCASFDTSKAQFFKVSELGKHAGTDNWYMADLTVSPTSTTEFTIPAALPAGEYIVRHELVAMHNGLSEGGVEFYPACFQVRVASNGRNTGQVPSGKEVVSFPGGYSPTEPGVLDPNVFNPGSVYTPPGPPLAAIATANPPSGSSSSGTDSPSSTVGTIANTSSSASSSSAPAPTATGGGCGGSRQKKRVIKRIVQQGPLIKRHKTSPHKRAASDGDKRQAELPGKPDWKRAAPAAEERLFVRSRVMRGI